MQQQPRPLTTATLICHSSHILPLTFILPSSTTRRLGKRRMQAPFQVTVCHDKEIIPDQDCEWSDGLDPLPTGALLLGMGSHDENLNYGKSHVHHQNRTFQGLPCSSRAPHGILRAGVLLWWRKSDIFWHEVTSITKSFSSTCHFPIHPLPLNTFQLIPVRLIQCELCRSMMKMIKYHHC